MQRILFATEGSRESTEAIETFVRLLGPGDRLFTVVTAVPPARRPDADPRTVAYYQAATCQAEDIVSHITARLQSLGHPAQGLVLYADPADAILDAARTFRADLIVLASHARHGIARVIQGSVAERVLREAPCAVTIYPWNALHATPEPHHAGGPARNP